nr:SfnB family sulfur acquisition oxidoreductase [Xylophilus sp.]
MPHRVHPFPRPQAHRIASDAEALAVADGLAAGFAQDAARRDRDRERVLPVSEIDRFSASGLWAITVPKTHGGAGVSQRTLVEVFRRIAQADPSIAQIPQSHFTLVHALALDGTPAQQAFFFAELLAGVRFGNAVSERDTPSLRASGTRIVAVDKGFVVRGRKFYATGALFADWIGVSARDIDDQPRLAFVESETPGLEVIDDWDAIGQRTTASGSVRIDEVAVESWQLLDGSRFVQPTLAGPASQLLQAAIDAGIARAALADTLAWVRERSRPWIDSGVERAALDPLTLGEIGRLQVQLSAAEALLERAAGRLDDMPARSTPAQAGAASITVAEAKAATTEIALAASGKLFELAGTQAALSGPNLDRHWRNARIHTLHDPVRWKYHAIGAYQLNGTLPPHHLWF